MATSAHTSPRSLAPRLKRLVPWLSGLLLVAGIVAAIVAFTTNRNPPKPAPVPAALAPKPAAKPRTVALSKETVAIARQFVTTAVARRDLAAAWKISGPDIRGGLTLKEWLTGNIPVVPFPVKSVSGPVRFKIDWSYKNQAGIDIALLPASGKVKPQIFFMLLKRVGPSSRKHWIVASWVPHSSPIVPLGTN
jgi:hypothetical protein